MTNIFEELIEAIEHINLLKTMIGIGEVALVVLEIVDPPAVAIVNTAIAAGNAIIASLNGTQATQSQINALTMQSQALNNAAAPHVTVTANGVGS